MKRMDTFIRRCLLLLLLLLLAPSLSAHAFAEKSALNRPMISLIESGEWEAWGQLDYFDSTFDVLNYAGKLGTSSGINSFRVISLGLRYGITERINLMIAGQISDLDAYRSVDPKQIQSRYWGEEVRLQYAFYDSFPLRLAVEAGWRGHQSNKESFNRYQSGNTILSNPNEPVVTFESRDSAWLGAVRLLYEPWSWLHLGLGAEYRRVNVRATALVNHPWAESLIRDELPQLSPWKERHVLLQLNLGWQPWDFLEFAADLTHYSIRRSGYEPNPAKLDYTSALQLDGYLFWHVARAISLYGHGRANSRFVLGDLPLAYNRRVNHRFANPFGMLSIGAVVRF